MLLTVPLIPTGFNITMEFFTVSNLTAMFEWDEPQGHGPEAIVDNYAITFSPRPLSLSDMIDLPNFPLSLNVTLDYNIVYKATITAENCAGRSETFVYPNVIEYGIAKYYTKIHQ